MKLLHMLATGMILAALPVFAALPAEAGRPSAFGLRTPPPPHHHGGGKHGGPFIPFIVVEREVPVIVEREVVVREVPAAPPAPPPEPRKPYVVGKSYASLPASCLKLIEGGASYYYCGGGEWYRLSGKRYLAVAR